MNGALKRRGLITCCLLAACFTAFSCRLVQLQVSKHEEYRRKAAERNQVKQPIYARRGLIFDVNGEPLARNSPVRTVIADASLIEDQAAVVNVLREPLGMSEAALREKLSAMTYSQPARKYGPSRYIIVKKKVPVDVAGAIEAELSRRSLRGVSFEQDFARIYPNNEMLCHVLGAVNSDDVGLEGIEQSMDASLRGRDGYRYIERDRKGRELVPYRGSEVSPEEGRNLRLTVDMRIQAIVEDELDAAVKQFKPTMATCVLMDPHTGAILAMASRPHFNPNQRNEVDDAQRKNRAVTDMVEPGSTFKIVTAAAALQHKLVKRDTYIFCENGRFMFGGSPLRDHRPYADLSVEEVMMKSSNIGFAKMALQLGEQKLWEYVQRFGFGQRTQIALPGEIPGRVHPLHRWSKISITRVPMGHEVGVTALQMVTAMCVIANGGTLLMPQIVAEISDNSGKVLETTGRREVRQVVSRETAGIVRDMLVQVVSKQGTAPLAHVSGFKVAGKTGTAQKIGPNGNYLHGRAVVSFAGFMPAENPEFCAIVLLDDPTTKPGENYGGLVAAPIFSRIAERTARYLNLPPSPDEPPGDVVITQTRKTRE